MTNALIALALTLTPFMTSAASPVTCRCQQYTRDANNSYYFLQAYYKDAKGVPRDLMMGAYPTLESCKIQMKKMVDSGRCQAN